MLHIMVVTAISGAAFNSYSVNWCVDPAVGDGFRSSIHIQHACNPCAWLSCYPAGTPSNDLAQLLSVDAVWILFCFASAVSAAVKGKFLTLIFVKT